MNKRDDDALNYVIGTNGLENVKLTKEEIEKILEDVQNGKRDKSFLFEVVKELERRKREKYEEEHGRQRL